MKHALAAIALAACSTAAEPAKAPEAPAAKDDQPVAKSAAPAEKAAEAPEGLPTACAKGSTDKICLPPAYLAKGLCNADYPTVALAMFAKGTPWTRAYSVTTSSAWNASGGSSSNEKMNMFEEILVLRVRGADTSSGIQVSGAGASYDVLRWDGSCVTLQEGEFVFDHPPQASNARVIFKHLEPHVRDALKEVPELEKLHRDWRKECKGVTVGDVSDKCQKLDGQFSNAIVSYVRDKGGVPAPHKLPKP